MVEGKVVRRRVVFCIAVLCIVPLMIFGGVLQLQNTNLHSQASSNNLTINTLNSKINSLNAEITSLQGQITSENTSNTKLQNQLNSQIQLNSAIQKVANQATQDQSTISTDQMALSSNSMTITQQSAQISSLATQVASLQAQIALSSQNSIGNGFSIIQISDTQYLSDSWPDAFDDLTSWIVNNSEALNLAMVVHTGDIVQIPNNTTDWQAANTAMMTLYNNEVPYCWNAGNHDQFPYTDGVTDGNPNGRYIGGNFPAFNVTLMRQEPYWVGDIYHGTSTAVKFNFGNYHFMIVNVEYDANQTVLNWMQTLINSNPNVNFIVATHNFLNGNGTYGTLNAADQTWATNFQNIIQNDPNVFMTINGHDIDYGPAANIQVGNIQEIFFNRQQYDNLMGSATARIYTFNFNNPAKPVVDVYTYQDYGSPHYLTDPANQFTFAPNLIAYSPSLSPLSITKGTYFLGASGYSVSFATSASLQSFSQFGDTLTFNGLTLNGLTLNFTVTVDNASILINTYNSTMISYTVSGGGGTQIWSIAAQPASVYFGNVLAPSNDWAYSSTVTTETSTTSWSTGEVTITGATSSVTINLATSATNY